MNISTRRRIRLGAAAAVVLITAAAALRAQAPSALEQQLRRIYQSNDYAADTFGPAVWFDDGSYGVVDSYEGCASGDFLEGDGHSFRAARAASYNR